MLIIKTTMIAILAVVAVIGLQHTASATRDDYVSETTSVKVTLKRVDSTTGNLQVQVIPQNDDSKTRNVNPFNDGFAGNVKLSPFEFSDEQLANGDNVQVCVFELDHDNVYVCDNEIVQNNVAKISLVLPGVIQSSYNVPTYYDEDGNVISTTTEDSNNVKQGDDSTNTESSKDAGVSVSFGDNNDYNTVNIDQRSTFADVIRDLVPIAKEGAHMAKDTAAQLLN